MNTVGSYISEARVSLSENNADSLYTDRFIFSKIEKHARWIIKREADKLKIIHYDSLFQTIKCMPVEEAPTIDPCCGVKSRCKVFRTCEKLPTLYEDSDGVIIKDVFSIDGSSDFYSVKINEYMRKLEDPNSKYDKTDYYFYNNGYLYFPNNRLKMIAVKGLFEQNVYNQCDNDEPPCISRQDQTFWFPDVLRGELMDFVMKDLLVQKQIPEDNKIDKQSI